MHSWPHVCLWVVDLKASASRSGGFARLFEHFVKSSKTL